MTGGDSGAVNEDRIESVDGCIDVDDIEPMGTGRGLIKRGPGGAPLRPLFVVGAVVSPVDDRLPW